MVGIGITMAAGGNECDAQSLCAGMTMGLSDHAALVTLLIAKGLFTEVEYFEAMATAAEKQKVRWEQTLSAQLGKNVTLG